MSHKGSHMGSRKGKKAPSPSRRYTHTRTYMNTTTTCILGCKRGLRFLFPEEEKSREKVNPSSSSSSHFPFFPSPTPSFISRFIGGRGKIGGGRFLRRKSPSLPLFFSHPCFLFSAAVWPRPASFRHSGQFQSPPPLFLSHPIFRFHPRDRPLAGAH